MTLNWIDILMFCGFFALVIGISLSKSREEKDSKDYFLAGRALSFGLIGFSLIASNISTEHFVGMAGSGFGNMGLAVASYEWLAAITLVFVALLILPRFLKCGIYTIPEFLEYRYNAASRAVMAIFMMIMYVAVALASILYAGAIGLTTIFNMDLTLAVWLIGIIAGAYTIYGGLKAVVWTDLFQGAALLIGGATVMFLGFRAVGGLPHFLEMNAPKLHMILPLDHPEIPWSVLLLGLWIPNIFYWGFNQFIVQRTLGAKSLQEGQKGIILAAGLKLLIPFIIVFPGIMAYQLFADKIAIGDQAYPTLVREILPSGLRGIMFAALFGAVLSSLDSMLNSASTIFTMDIYNRHIKPETSSHQLVKIGRLMTGVFVLIACLIAPNLDNPKFGGIFKYIQMFQGFISPGIVTVFLIGFIMPKAPPVAAITAMLSNIVIYGGLLWLLPNVPFLNHMAITFLVLVTIMVVTTLLKPLKEPVKLPEDRDMDITPSSSAKIGAGVIIAITITLYILFW
ncbi:solute:sodium symporter family transporter [bacterium]|nr:solute:sodium symporter family transporter [bacterium]